MIPALVPQVSGPAYLPVGRYRCDPDEVEARFVNGHGTDRQEVWNDWQTVVAALRSVLPVCAAWVAGSFPSDKPDPDDVDSVFLLPYNDIMRIRQSDPQGSQFLDLMAQNRLRDQFGLRVDTFQLSWPINPRTAPQTPAHYQYLGWRGLWDDFWVRRRSGSKTAPPVLSDALPRRGYLEVILDGFAV